MILFILLLLSIVGVSLVAYAYMPVVSFVSSVVAMASTVIAKAFARLLARAFFIVKDFAVTVITTAKDAVIITCDIFAKKAKMTKVAFFSFVKERKEKAVFTVKVNVAVIVGGLLTAYDNLVATVKKLVVIVKEAIAEKADTLMNVINASAVVVLSIISLFRRTMDKIDSAITTKVEAKRASNVVKVENWSIGFLAKAFAIAEFIDGILVEKPSNNNVDGFAEIEFKKVDVAEKVTETLKFVFLPFLLGRKINELRVKEWEVNLKKWKEELERR